MVRDQRDLYQRVAGKLADYLAEMPAQLASAWKAGNQDQAPFAAQTSQKQRLAYFTTLVQNADGTPNLPGREKLMEQYGVANYTQIVRTVLKAQGLGPVRVAADALQGDE